MDIGKMGNIQPNKLIKDHNKFGLIEDPLKAVADSFVSGDKQAVKHPDLKKAAGLLMKKTSLEARDDWSLESNGVPSVITEKSLILGGFDINIRAVDPKTGADKWTSEVRGHVFEGREGTLFAGNNKTLSALDPDTGKEKWSMKFDFNVQVFKVGDDGTVYAKTSSTTYAVDPEKQKIKWQCKALGFPEVGDNRKVVISDGYHDVTRIDPDTGKEMWTYNTIGKCNSAPVFGKNGDVYACDYLGMMTAVDPETGKQKWQFKTDSSILEAPLVGPDGDIYVNSNNQQIYAVDPETGNEKWHFKGEGFNNSFSSFAPDGTILFAGGDRVYGLHPKSGKKLWEKKMPGAVDHTPVQGKDGRVYLKCWDKKVYSIRIPDFKELIKENINKETGSSEPANEKLQIRQENEFVDIGGVRLKVNKFTDK